MTREPSFLTFGGCFSWFLTGGGEGRGREKSRHDRCFEENERIETPTRLLPWAKQNPRRQKEDPKSSM